MSSKGKRSPSRGGSQKGGKTLLPAFIIAPLGAENSPARARINYLEEQIAAALLDEGFKAELITSDGGKERITEHMIKRLTEDELAVAVMDDFNRNVMYEVAIRHALCLPTIHVIDVTAKGAAPFDLLNVELTRYPKLRKRAGKFSWDQPTADAFRKKLQQRAQQQRKAPLSGMFAKGLHKASAAGILTVVFNQKRRELDFLVRELRLNVGHITNDYKLDAPIDGPRAKHHAELLYSKFTQLHIANDTLLELIEGANLAAVQSDHCSSICKRISEVTEQLAAVIKTLRNAATAKNSGTKNASLNRLPPPTCRTVVAELENIITESRGLAREIASLHGIINL